MPTKLTNEIIIAAITGFESQKTRIDLQIAELRAMLDGGTKPADATPELPKRKRRKMSAAGRKAIAEAQRKRWAVSKPAPAATEPSKPKRRLSKAGKAAIVAATKKRWAAFHAAKQTKKPALKKAVAKRNLSPARKAALVANLAKAREAKAAKAAAGAR